jgi:signal transduction histidine kinase
VSRSPDTDDEPAQPPGPPRALPVDVGTPSAPTTPPRPSPLRQLTDLAIAVASFALLCLGVLAYEGVAPPDAPPVPPMAVWAGLGAALTLPLAIRRRAPLTVLVVITVAFAAFRLAQVPEGSVSAFALFLSIYTVGAELPPRRSRWPRALSIGAMFVLLAVSMFVELPWGESGELPGGVDLLVLQSFSLLYNVAFFVAAWVLGDLMWKRRDTERRLAERADELEATRDALARRAVQDERVRIARELHDVVAHHVSVMGIQAGAARRAIARDPDRASQALANVEQASRDAVTELQRLLGFLRSDDDATDLLPQPTLGELDSLIDTVRETGLQVTIRRDGVPRAVPSSVELSAYRIVQEALTNTLKHAPRAVRADVTLRYGPSSLDVLVRDDGDPSAALGDLEDRAAGRGLVGMRERAGLHGGTLTAGPTDDGGFLVSASLPLSSTATRATATG